MRIDMKADIRATRATDGQGVIVAFPFASQTQQRPSIDLLARRVGHRLGCPVETCALTRGQPLLDGALRRLSDRSARSIVVAPATFTLPLSMQRMSPAVARLRVAAPLGGGEAVVQSVADALAAADRPADDAVRVVIAIPASEVAMASLLGPHLPVLAARGWGDGAAVVVPPQPSEAEEALASVIEGHPAIVVALSIAPSPFVGFVGAAAQRVGADAITQTLHSSESLTQLVVTQVNAARRGA